MNNVLNSHPERLPAGWKTGLCLVLLAVAAVSLLTQPPDYIDTFNYATHVVNHGRMPAAKDPFWEFGHVMWRPIGLLFWRTLPVQHFSPEPVFQVAWAMILLNAASVLICTVFLYLLFLRLTQTVWIAGFTAFAFIASRAVLDYVLTGMAYTAGITLQIASFYLLFLAIQDNRLTTSRAWLSGILAGASVCLWFPYSFTLTGFLVFGFLWGQGKNRPEMGARARFLAMWVAAIAVMLAVCYIPVVEFRGIHNLTELRAWISASRYGINPTSGGLRAAMAFPRSFVWMGDAGVLFKRFLFDSGGSRLALLPSLLNGIWKLALVYGVLALLAYYLMRTPAGRKLMVCLFVTAIPTMIFAIFLFDPAPPIRYIALYPLLFFGLAWVVSEERNSTLRRVVLPGFCLMIGAINLVGMSRFYSDTDFTQAHIRLEALNEHVAPPDRVLILALQDDANRLANNKPFDPVSRNRPLLWAVIPLGTDNLRIWRSMAAEAILETWGEGGRVWLSKRMLAPTPRADWRWVEGDDYRITWAEIPRYFRQFEVAHDFGGDDGFVELVRSSQNEMLLREAKDSQ